ncbi:MAG: DUF4350 domain-containing protein, partial [Catenulisporales bacterium]|nr:DUF4350 domain-containing protein [Catenulisporales bacterium]
MKLRAWRWPLAALSVLLLGALFTALTLGGDSGGTLDPDSASADGGRALASLLREHGVTITPARTTADAASAVQSASGDATLLVTDPGLLTPSQLDMLAATPVARLVAVQPDSLAARRLTGDAASAWPAAVQGRATLVDPACADADATAAGNADIGDGKAFGVSPQPGCYPLGSAGYALVMLSGPASADTVLIGSRTPFRNDRLADHGNAALTLRLLGKHPTVVWYLPDSADPDAVSSDHKSFTEVLPAGWRWGALTMVLAVALLAGVAGPAARAGGRRAPAGGGARGRDGGGPRTAVRTRPGDRPRGGRSAGRGACAPGGTPRPAARRRPRRRGGGDHGPRRAAGDGDAAGAGGPGARRRRGSGGIGLGAGPAGSRGRAAVTESQESDMTQQDPA